MSIDTFFERLVARHADEVVAGLHDSECEYGPRQVVSPSGISGVSRIHMCHCSKRRRIAAGHIETPGPLLYRNPECPRCWAEVSHNGDSWECGNCTVIWDPTDQDDDGEFTDDYGDLGSPVTGGAE